jgi:ABC-2 type transport system permease protein
MVRSYKLIWLPISFIILGATQPITTFFLPDILASSGDLPEGTILSLPTPKPFEVLASSLEQFGLMGVLLIALSSMGAVSGERSSGVAAMILVKPVSFVSFVTAKWAALFLIAALSFILGYSAAWYYTGTLFGPVEWRDVVTSALLFTLWLGFVGTLALMFSSLFRSSAVAAFGAIASAILLTVVSSTLPYKQIWNPGSIPKLASVRLDVNHPLADSAISIWLTAAITVAAIALALIVATGALKRRPSYD